MVQRQSEKWPYHDGKRQFTSKTNMDRMHSVLLNRTFGFTKEVAVVRPLSPSPPPPPLLPPPPPPPSLPPPPSGMPGQPQQSTPEPWQDADTEGRTPRDPQDGRCPPSSPPSRSLTDGLLLAQVVARAARQSGDEDKPAEDDDQLERRGPVDSWWDAGWDADAATNAACTKSVEVNVYVMFISPGGEVQRNAYSVKVLCVRQVNAFAHDPEIWTDTTAGRAAGHAGPPAFR